jgi:hypothetical protein
MATIPAAKNLVHNPRPVGLTYVLAGGAGTPTPSVTLVTDRSYSGNNSVLVSLGNSNSWLEWKISSDSDPDILAEAPGGTWRAMIHVSGPTPTNWNAFLRIKYSDATSTDSPGIIVNNPSTRFERFVIPDLVATPGKQVIAASIFLHNFAGNTGLVYVGGADIRHNQPIDSFIHGSAGTSYSWAGAVNDSPSNRAAFTTAPIIGSGGAVYPSVRLYVVDRNNQILREITDHFIDGDVSYDMDAETWKGSMRLILDDASLIRPLAMEFVRVILKLDYPDGTSEEGSLGQFMVDIPSERWSSGRDQWSYQGKDLLGVLAGTMAADGYGANAGTSYRTVIDDVCYVRCGLSPSQLSFPAITQVYAGAFSWEKGTTMLKILTDVLQAAGLQKPWVTPNGVITTSLAGVNPASVTPTITLATGQDSKLRWPFQVDPDVSGIGNRVAVISSVYEQNHTWIPPIPIGNVDTASSTSVFGTSYNPTVTEAKKKKKKKKHPNNPTPDEPTPPETDPQDIPGRWEPGYDPVFSQKVNDDPSHPISTVRLGRIIDLPNVEVPEVSGQAQADALALDALIKASSLPVRARITTVVMLRGLNEVYELDMMDADGNPIDSGQGRYWCRGWSLQLGLPWEMVHTLTRVIDFTATPYF